MKKQGHLGCYWIAAVFLLGTPGWAERSLQDDVGLFANAKEVFRPLLADPRELQMTLRWIFPVSRKNVGEAALGDYFGLYRWALPWQDAYVQWSVGGGIVARFDLVSDQKTSQYVDYDAVMPVDLRVGKWSTRFLPYHRSSHFGDDYVKETGILPLKFSLDSVKWLVAYEPVKALRLYGGLNYIMRNRYVDLGRKAAQAGLEWRSPWWAGGHAQAFWASDFQAWQWVGWNPMINTQLGVRIARNPNQLQPLSVFIEYGAGHRPPGQFFQQQESHWLLGLRFDLF